MFILILYFDPVTNLIALFLTLTFMYCLLGGLEGGQDGVLPEARPEVRGQGEPSQLCRGSLI